MNEKPETAQITEQVGCPAMCYQDVNVCIPITIKAFGEAGSAKIQCLGKSVVASGCTACPGKAGDVCKFTVSQKLRVEVPVIIRFKPVYFDLPQPTKNPILADKKSRNCDTVAENSEVV